MQVSTGCQRAPPSEIPTYLYRYLYSPDEVVAWRGQIDRVGVTKIRGPVLRVNVTKMQKRRVGMAQRQGWRRCLLL